MSLVVCDLKRVDAVLARPRGLGEGDAEGEDEAGREEEDERREERRWDVRAFVEVMACGRDGVEVEDMTPRMLERLD